MTATAESAPKRDAQRRYARHTQSTWRRLLTYEGVLVLVLVAFFVYVYINVPHFDSRLTTVYLLQDAAAVMIVAIPMAMVIISGEIDLSVASVAGLTSAVFGLLVQHGTGVPLAAVLALLVGLLCGLFNGIMIAYVGLPSLAMTIATLALYRGIAVGLLGIQTISDFPTEWTKLAQGSFPDFPRIPNIALLLLVLVVIGAFALHRTNLGRNLFDVGRNPEASRFAGVDVRKTKLATFAATAVCASLAGIYDALRFTSVRSDNNTGLELLVIAAIVLGGVSIFGGRGHLLGVIASVLLIGTLSSALRLENVNANTINVIIGVLLLVSVMLPAVSGMLTSRWRPHRKLQVAGEDLPCPSHKESAMSRSNKETV